MFQPIHQSRSVNGEFGRGLRLQDLNIRNIICVIGTTFLDPVDNTSKSGFEVRYYNDKQLKYDTILFESGFEGVTTIDQFKTYLDSLDSGHSIVKYTDYKRIHLHRDITPVRDILVNNLKIVKRAYIPAADETNLHVNFGNTIKHTVLTVDGDQTNSGTYYYA